jgi:hypothetical protein
VLATLPQGQYQGHSSRRFLMDQTSQRHTEISSFSLELPSFWLPAEAWATFGVDKRIPSTNRRVAAQYESGRRDERLIQHDTYSRINHQNEPISGWYIGNETYGFLALALHCNYGYGEFCGQTFQPSSFLMLKLLVLKFKIELPSLWHIRRLDNDIGWNKMLPRYEINQADTITNNNYCKA